MSQDIQEIRERQAESSARLENVEKKTAEIHEEFTRVSKLLRGNGEDGFFGQMQLNRERIEVLGRQWKWIVAILLPVGLAAVKSLFIG